MLPTRHVGAFLVVVTALSLVTVCAQELGSTHWNNGLDPGNFTLVPTDGSSVSKIDPDKCLLPGDLGSNAKTCDYIRTHCDRGNFRYAEFYYCIGYGKEDQDASRSSYTYVRLAISFGFLVMVMAIFFALGIVASHFLVPDLRHISQMANLDERTAGATLLSMGNGTPDLFATYAALESKSAALAIGELVGSATFVCTVVVGTMAVVRPFKVDGPSFSKDVAFFFVLLVVAFYFLHDGKLQVYECVSMIFLYAFYVMFVILRKDSTHGHAVEGEPLLPEIPHRLRPTMNRSMTPLSPTSTMSNSSRFSANSELVFENNVLAMEAGNAKLSLYDSLKLATREGDDRRFRSDSETVFVDTEHLVSPHSPVHGQRSAIPEIRIVPPTDLRIDTNLGNDEGYFEVTDAPTTYTSIILPEISDIHFSDRPLESGLLLGSIPFLVPLRLSVPVYPETDVEEDEQGLHRLMSLFGVQAFLSPFVISLGSGYRPLAGWWNMAVMAACGAVLSIIHSTLTNSLRTKQFYASNFRVVASASGFVLCLVWITVLSGELIRILKNMGVIFRVDEGMLGLTVLALGNSVGDLIANTALASLGTPQTGISACFGTPLLYILLGIGLNGLIVILGDDSNDSSLEFGLETNLYVSCGGLLLILIFYIVIVPRNELVISRKIGGFAILWWVLITTTNVVLELRRGSTGEYRTMIN